MADVPLLGYFDSIEPQSCCLGFITPHNVDIQTDLCISYANSSRDVELISKLINLPHERLRIY